MGLIADIGNFKAKNIGELIFWEDVMPYAVTFGLSKLVIKQLNIEFTKEELASAFPYNDGYSDTFDFNDVFSSSFDESLIQNSSASDIGSGSSSFGDSGGFSSGDSGGFGYGSGGGAF